MLVTTYTKPATLEWSFSDHTQLRPMKENKVDVGVEHEGNKLEPRDKLVDAQEGVPLDIGSRSDIYRFEKQAI